MNVPGIWLTIAADASYSLLERRSRREPISNLNPRHHLVISQFRSGFGGPLAPSETGQPRVYKGHDAMSVYQREADNTIAETSARIRYCIKTGNDKDHGRIRDIEFNYKTEQSSIGRSEDLLAQNVFFTLIGS